VLHEMLNGVLDNAILEQLETWFTKFYSILPFGHAEFAQVRSAEDLRSIWQGTLYPFFLDLYDNVRQPYLGAVEEFPWK
jgi:hypothetical protein